MVTVDCTVSAQPPGEVAINVMVDDPTALKLTVGDVAVEVEGLPPGIFQEYVMEEPAGETTEEFANCTEPPKQTPLAVKDATGLALIITGSCKVSVQPKLLETTNETL